MVDAGRDWRKLHDQLAAEHDALKDESLRAGQTLSRTIMRLCVAVDGLDPFLDPYLGRLRDAVRKGYNARLDDQLSEFTDAVVLAGEQRQSGDLLERLTGRLQVKGRNAARAKQLWTQIARAPGSATDDQLDELASLLGFEPAKVDEAPPRPRLLDRLLGHTATSATPAKAPNQQLVELLHQLDWPAVLAREAGELANELAASTQQDAWVGAVEQISDMVIASLRHAEQEAQLAQAFLSDLTAQLEVLDEHLSGEGKRRDDARTQAERLGETVQAEVGNLACGAAQASSLENLRQSLAGALQRIQHHVEQHLAREESQRRAAELRETELSAALRRLEEEAYDLKLKVASTQQMALRDALTGLPNRRAYDERLAHEYARWRRFREPLSLVVWDVDNFKQINDRYGHKAGDRALQLIANVLQRRLRETDFIARFGGEEFVVLLIGAGLTEALKVAEQMREAVGRAGLHSNNEPVPISISGGVSEFREQDETEAVFQRADKALYQAKSAGKNCCVTG